MSQVPCLHEHLANAARVIYSAVLQRSKLDTPLLRRRHIRKYYKKSHFTSSEHLFFAAEIRVEQGLLSAGKYGTILINYPVHGREKEPIFKNGKTLLNGILHVYTRTMGFSQYIGIVCCRFSEKYPI